MLDNLKTVHSSAKMIKHARAAGGLIRKDAADSNSSSYGQNIHLPERRIHYSDSRHEALSSTLLDCLCLALPYLPLPYNLTQPPGPKGGPIP
jgi:hypothetical protein